MDHPASRLATALLCAATALAAPLAAARAQGATASSAATPPLPRTAPPPAEKANPVAAAAPPTAPAVPAQRPVARTARPADPYRCHPAEDIACTVVRETPRGMVIVTLRGPGSTAQPSVWSVVTGTPPASAGAPSGGTVYVIPTARVGEAERRLDIPQLVPANGAPILD